jgi:hypothetical protein
MNKIYTGLDRAREMGFTTYRDYAAALASRSGRPWNGKISHDPKHAVVAFIDSGRWGWACECGNPHYAEPNEPIGYCAVCGNAVLGGQARLVIFPDNVERAAIEAALLEREIEAPKGIDLGTQTVLLPACKPIREGCHRSWRPGEKPADLRAEYRKARVSNGA